MNNKKSTSINEEIKVKTASKNFIKKPIPGIKHAIAVSSGTAALDVAVEALGIGPGDEVILPSFTIISCISQIVRSGAKPVLVDSDPLTWNMDPNQILGKITERTKAIMIVHIFGLPVDMESIMDIATKHNIKIK